MNKLFLLIVSSLAFTLRPTPYQDMLVGNKIIRHGGYSCTQRYNVIKPLLKKYERPFTVLDIGASQGFFSLKTAYDFKNSTCVMIEGGYSWAPKTAHLASEDLLKLCTLNSNLNNIVFLRKQVNLKDLKKIAQKEHFDVIYALNILHHFPKEHSKKAVDLILSMADNVVIELPSYTSPELQKYVAEKIPHVIGKFERSKPKGAYGTMRLYQRETEISDNLNLVNPKKNTFKVKSNYKLKKLIKLDQDEKVVSVENWVPGINISTFNLFNGVWPTKNNFKNLLSKIIVLHHKIKSPKVVIQGKRLKIRNLKS